ncbi:unnamed protein product [Prunus armeniaca]
MTHEGYALTSTVSRKKRRRGCTRTGCKAKLVILKVKDKNKYIVVGFNEVHNHDMTIVDKVHLLRSHQNLTESTKVYSADMSKVNIPVHKQLSLLEVQVGGLENVGYVKRDVYNYLRDVRGEVIGYDAELLKEHFMAMQEKSESFYFNMEVDSEGRMGNIFWSDARSRRAYGFLEMWWYLIRRSTRTAMRCSLAFVRQEFKKAMPGEPSKMIITDKDVAMSKAIAGMDKKEEFDAKWEEIITNNGLQDHAWLSSIHAMRENWVPSYVKHVFSPGMSSSQRHKELMADHVDNNEKPPLPFQTPIQHQMGHIYTRGILEMFEREDFRSLLCLFELVEQDET